MARRAITKIWPSNWETEQFHAKKQERCVTALAGENGGGKGGRVGLKLEKLTYCPIMQGKKGGTAGKKIAPRVREDAKGVGSRLY